MPASPGIAVLRISSVSDRESGDYVCVATSAAGTIEEQFVIRVDRGDGGDGGGIDEGKTQCRRLILEFVDRRDRDFDVVISFKCNPTAYWKRKDIMYTLVLSSTSKRNSAGVQEISKYILLLKCTNSVVSSICNKLLICLKS